MKNVTLKFPNIIELAKFHISYMGAKIHVDIKNYSLTGEISDEHIVIACTKHRAIAHK